MEAAKASVKNFLAKSGHHDTTVHRKVVPAVQNETVVKEEHEETTLAVEREIHQDHHKTTVQPIKHEEVLPEQHHSNIISVEHKTFEHDNEEEIKRSLDQEREQFFDTSKRVEGQHTSSVVPTVEGVHVHHHVHETIQPVIHKQTYEPHVIHTVVPVHEVHHNKSKHHTAQRLPTMTMDDFVKSGGMLKGSDEKHDFFNGDPTDLETADTPTAATTELLRDMAVTDKTEKKRDSVMDGSDGRKSVDSASSANSGTMRPHTTYPLRANKHGP